MITLLGKLDYLKKKRAMKNVSAPEISHLVTALTHYMGSNALKGYATYASQK